MKVSYRTHEIFKYLESGVLDESIQLSYTDLHNKAYLKHRQHIKYVWCNNVDFYRSKIDVLHTPFVDAWVAANDKLSKCIGDYHKPTEYGGTLIYRKHSIAFRFYYQKETCSCNLFWFYDNMFIGFLDFDALRGTKKWYLTLDCFDISESDTKAQLDKLFSLVSSLNGYLKFLMYARIETKELNSGKRDVIHNCKYANDTKSNVRIINSTWFTNLVKSDAFKVRGHFRLQPKKKDGEWTKELIWISDFMKNGYTAPARKLSVYPNE